MARRIKERKLKNTAITIIGEGATERYYFTHLLRRYIPSFSKQQAYLSKENWVATMLADNKLATAITNAIAIGEDGESYSNLHKLFTRLNS